MTRLFLRCTWLSIVAVALTFSGGLFAAEPAGVAAPEQWAQWRGPLNGGVAPKAAPPTEWSETKNIEWKVKLPGHGTATPIVWQDRIYLQAAIPVEKTDTEKADAEKPSEKADGDKPSEKPAADKDEKKDDKQPAPPRRGGPGGGFGRSDKPTSPFRFVVLCLDRATGKTVWEKTVNEVVPHEGHHADHGFASYSAVTDGRRIISYFGSRGLHCLDMNGNLKWSKDLGKMQTRNGFGEGSSPALYGDTIVVNWDHEGDDDFTAAFNANTGDELWRQKREEATSWGTPLVVVHEGKPQVVTNATRRVRSYDLATGELVWECSGLTTNSIPSPVAADGVVYSTSGFRGGALLAIRLGAKGDLTNTESILWTVSKHTPYVPSPLLYGDRIYVCSSNNAVISSFDIKTGKPQLNQERLSGLSGVYASPVGAADKVYVVGRNGTTAVLKNADKMELLATNKLDERIDASPAIAGKNIYLRSHESLYSITEK